MKLLTYVCREDELPIKSKWITDELGFHIFKIQKVFSINDFGLDHLAIIFIVNTDEEESYLKLKYPSGTFKDFTA